MFSKKKDLGTILKGFMTTIEDLEVLATSKDDELMDLAIKQAELEEATLTAIDVGGKARSVASKLKAIVGD